MNPTPESNTTGEFPSEPKMKIPAGTGDKPCHIATNTLSGTTATAPDGIRLGSSTELRSAPGKTKSPTDLHKTRKARRDTFLLQNAMHRLVWQHVREQRRVWIADQEAAHAGKLAVMSQKQRRQWYKDQRKAARVKFKNRVTACTKQVAPDHDEGIAYGIVRYSEADQRASYGHMMRCDNASCPICGRVKAESNRFVLDRAIAAAYLQGKAIAFVTFTLRHSLTSSLADTDRLLMDAQAAMRKGRPWRRFKEKWGWIETVRAWETTHTLENGWHPHRHEIVLLERELTPEEQREFREELRDMWLRFLEDEGGDATREHGVNVVFGDDAKEQLAAYVNKFGHLPQEDDNQDKTGLAMEATYSHTKQRDSYAGRSPLKLLDDYDKGDEKAGRLWAEYFAAVKGKQFLIGLKRFCEAVGLDRDELVAEAEAEAEAQQQSYIDVLYLTEAQMQLIVRRGQRADLLEHVEAVRGDDRAVEAFIPRLGSDQQPPPLWANIPMSELDQAVREYLALGNSPVNSRISSTPPPDQAHPRPT